MAPLYAGEALFDEDQSHAPAHNYELNSRSLREGGSDTLNGLIQKGESEPERAESQEDLEFHKC
jgi:hypothetical protein